VQIVAADDVLVRVQLPAVRELDLEHPPEPAQQGVGKRVPIRLLARDHLPGDECGALHARTLSACVSQDNAASQRAAHSPVTRAAWWYQTDTIGSMAMTLRLTDDQAAALRARAEREGRSMQQVAVSALDEYLLRTQDDELTDRIAARGAERFADLLRRLGE
jgi:predicted transcriptional regulator